LRARDRIRDSFAPEIGRECTVNDPRLKSEACKETYKPILTKPSFGKHTGVHTGRVAVKATGSFNLQTVTGTIQGISHTHRRRLRRADGYTYHLTAPPSLRAHRPPAQKALDTGGLLT